MYIGRIAVSLAIGKRRISMFMNTFSQTTEPILNPISKIMIYRNALPLLLSHKMYTYPQVIIRNTLSQQSQNTIKKITDNYKFHNITFISYPME